MKILVVGAAGHVGKLVVHRLLAAGHTVMGVDRHPWPEAPSGFEHCVSDFLKRAAEDQFRTRRPEAVIHLATVTHLVAPREERARVNLQGAQVLLSHCAHFGVGRLVYVGHHTFYGASPDAPLYHREEEAPAGLGGCPELADLITADLYVSGAFWRQPQLELTVLRPCYSLGPSGEGALASLLTGPRVPMVLGFDPLLQFMHEAELAEAIVRAVEVAPRGVFNVAGPAPLPLSTVIERTGRLAMAVPEALHRPVLGRLGLPVAADGATSHLKYPVVVDGTAFQSATGFVATQDALATLEAFALAHPSGHQRSPAPPEAPASDGG
jgi:UDP-glucose 4-epimerase